MENKEIHPFEKSGLGIAPFHFHEYYKTRTSCEHCGTPIIHTFVIISSDGKKFKVGSSCVNKTDPVLYKAVKAARQAYIVNERNERREEGRKAWKLKKEKESAEKLSLFKESNLDVFNFLESKKNESDFYFSLYNQVVTWGNLSEKQMSAVTKAMNPVVSEYVGEVGKKMEFSLTISNILTFDGQWGTIRMYIMEDPKGNKVVYKGSGVIFIDIPEESICNGEKVIFNSYHPAGTGDKVVLTAKVKSHAEYKGTKQTIIERFKVKEIIKK